MSFDNDISVDVSTDRVALYNPIEAGLADMEDKYKDGPKDLSIPAHYEECRLALSETRGTRSKTEKLRKELKADALAYGRLVDSTAKRIIDKVLEIEEPYAVAKKEFDTRIEIEKREKALAEERRVDGISNRIAEIGSLVAAHVSSTSEVIKALLPKLVSDLETCGEWAMEFSAKAESTIRDTLEKLAELLTMKMQQEQYAADKAKAEKEAAEKAEADRLQREKEVAEERERLAKERAALDAERAAIKAEQDKLAAEQAEKDRVAKAEQAEKDKATEVERAKMAAEIEALKKAHEPPPRPEETVQCNQQTTTPPATTSNGATDDYKAAGQAIKAITGNLATAKAILDKIINGEIPHIQFTGAAQ